MILPFFNNIESKVVAVGGGVSYGNLGYSHHAVQDYALMRSFPNMLIVSPGSNEELSEALKYIVQNPTKAISDNTTTPINKFGQHFNNFSIPKILTQISVPNK